MGGVLRSEPRSRRSLAAACVSAKAGLRQLRSAFMSLLFGLCDHGGLLRLQLTPTLKARLLAGGEKSRKFQHLSGFNLPGFRSESRRLRVCVTHLIFSPFCHRWTRLCRGAFDRFRSFVGGKAKVEGREKKKKTTKSSNLRTSVHETCVRSEEEGRVRGRNCCFHSG